MKVQASAFEPPVTAAALEAGDRARLEEQTHSEDGIAPIESVQTQLNPATRQSLSKLALLIQSQVRSQMSANEKAEDEAREESKEKKPKFSALEGDAQKANEAIIQESVQPAAFPHVARATAVLKIADRKRGFGVYGEVKSKAIVELVVQELAERSAAKAKSAA